MLEDRRVTKIEKYMTLTVSSSTFLEQDLRGGECQAIGVHCNLRFCIDRLLSVALILLLLIQRPPDRLALCTRTFVAVVERVLRADMEWIRFVVFCCMRLAVRVVFCWWRLVIRL